MIVSMLHEELMIWILVDVVIAIFSGIKMHDKAVGEAIL